MYNKSFAICISFYFLIILLSAIYNWPQRQWKNSGSDFNITIWDIQQRTRHVIKKKLNISFELVDFIFIVVLIGGYFHDNLLWSLHWRVPVQMS